MKSGCGCGCSSRAKQPQREGWVVHTQTPYGPVNAKQTQGESEAMKQLFQTAALLLGHTKSVGKWASVDQMSIQHRCLKSSVWHVPQTSYYLHLGKDSSEGSSQLHNSPRGWRQLLLGPLHSSVSLLPSWASFSPKHRLINLLRTTFQHLLLGNPNLQHRSKKQKTRAKISRGNLAKEIRYTHGNK